jgi:hypothetical protein
VLIRLNTSLSNNIAMAFSFQKRRSNDRLSHTTIRASYLVASDLACKLFVSCTPRRADVESILTDDLSQIGISTSLDPHTYRSMDEKPII